MVLQALFFYLFAGIAVASAFMVIAARNPVHSVLFLILCFINAAALFVLIGAEYLAMLLIVVYVGAVMVLFLFVVMMLDVDFAEMKRGVLQYLPIGGLVGFILLAELLMAIGGWVIMPEAYSGGALPIVAEGKQNIAQIGAVLYTKYIFYFQACGIILLVAMIGAIVLTLRHKPNVKRQDIPTQVARTPETSIEVVSVESGKGI
ncbi:NADH-quinone oxidoreductase subunit J [Polycladidibacter hongkongensis]|uniref:NADH-quinone oxidoreductase subunit J n=1 Tax=Polycladidibacter hongkongensis TaxID=1647556 RepID=UPI0008317ECC|nr:NADH-quinone oxidoreductase subunit J [Pseudovibrio hongkongensis]